MASSDITITVTEDIAKALEKIGKEVQAAKDALSDEHIRAIVREELAAWEKSLPLRIRASMGWPAHVEVK